MSLNLSNIISFRTFRTDGDEWKRFLKIVFLAAGVPLLFIFVVLEVVAWRVGETLPFTWAAQEQAEDPDLLWSAGRQENYASFKLARVNIVRPDILVMGQSRLGQLRGAMFHPYSFYNLSRVSWPYETYVEILRHLPGGYHPKVIIFSLDYFMFNPLYSKYYANLAPIYGAPNHGDSLADVLLELRKSPSLIFASHRSPAGLPVLGLAAYKNSSGTRQDGSELWPAPLLKETGGDPDMLHKIKWDDPQFFQADAMDKGEMKTFEEFVTLAHSKGITLIGVQMPMYGPVVRALKQNPHYGILRDFRDHIASGYFERLGIIVFDDLTFPPYTDDYRYFINALHPTEAVNAAVVVQMFSDPRVKAVLPKLDTAGLQRKLEQNKNADQHYDLYRNNE
jgi:hypothetical protein